MLNSCRIWSPTEPHTPPPLTHFVRIDSILIHAEKGGGGGRVEPERRLDGNSSQSWVEKTNMSECISPVYKL